ncbi:MAG TPA: protein kinase [Kofleriaceae bacterium]|nr:protein kinase [Kofleriaceae bacterium]
MGDAECDGEVHPGDLEDTIDAEPAGPAVDRPEPDLPKREALDYPELIAVERQHYAVAGEIAKGGMGRVLEARDLRLGRRVAIKELLPKNRHAARRFEREARITARLQHPAIVHVYEAGVWPGGEPFYAMNHVTGDSFDKVVARRATLVERLGLIPNVIAVADALAYAHSEGVIHRDLKPSNVLIGEFGETVVIDWGLAKELGAPSDAKESMSLRAQASDETASGSVVGTPAYMPPEQARGEPVDQRADVYALGALLYKVLTGEAPYHGDTSAEVIEQVRAGPPVPVQDREPGAPPDLIAIVRKAMARDPDARYPDCGALAQDLKRFQTGQLVAAHRYTAGQLFVRFVRRRRLAIAIAAVAITAIAIIATVSVRGIVDERARAEARRYALLYERGVAELRAGHPGSALAYLAEAAKDGARGGARGYLIADAIRPFEARLARLDSGPLVAVSPDGKHVATAGLDAVVLWSSDGRREHVLGDHGQLHSLAFDRAGTRLLGGGETGVAWIWSIDGTQLDALEESDHAAIFDARFSPDGTRVVLARSDGTATVWELASGMRLHSACFEGALPEGPRPTVSARFSTSGDRIVTANMNGTACVWGALSGVTMTKLHPDGQPLNAAEWTHDDEWVVTASDDGTARVWSAECGKYIVQPLVHDPGSSVRTIAIAPDQRTILTAGSDQVARIWRLPAGAPDACGEQQGTAKLVATLAGHVGTIVDATFSSDGSEVATAGLDRLARIWDPATGQVLASFEELDAITSIAFAADNTRLVTGSAHYARLWDARIVKQRTDFGSPVHAIAVTRDGAIAAAVTEDSQIHLTSRPDAPLHDPRQHSPLRAVAFTRDGRRLISAGDDAYPQIWDVATGARVGQLGFHPEPVRAIAIADDDVAATASRDGVRLWWPSGASHQLDGRATSAIAFQPEGALIVAGEDDGTLTTWYGMVEATYQPRCGAISAVAFSPDGGRLIVAGMTDAKIYRAGVRVYLAEPIALDGAGEVRAAQFTADGTRVITAGGDGIARIWDAATGKELGRRGAHGKALEALAIHDDDTLWLASSDGTISAFDIHADTRSAAELDRFVRERGPWRLDRDDRLVRNQGGSDGQRGSDRE